MTAKGKSVLVRLFIASFVLLCTVQALYWPLIPKHGFELHWWQVEWLAKTGYVLGLPVMILAPGANEQLLLAASVTWSAGVYFLLGPFVNWCIKPRSRV